MRPAFNYPMVRPTNMVPTAGDFVLVYLNPMSVPCSPEPPWIKRCSYGIKFTDDLQITDSLDLAMETQDDRGKKESESESSSESGEGKNKYGKTSVGKQSLYCRANSAGNVRAPKTTI